MFLLKDSPKHGLLNINGVDITQENGRIYSDYAELPLTEVMKSFGMKVDWIDEGTAEITYRDKKYIFILSEVLLSEVEGVENLLSTPPGGKRSYTILNEELILDCYTIKSALQKMGIKIKIDINRKDRVVYIIERTYI